MIKRKVYVIAHHTGAITGTKKEGFAFSGYYQGHRINHIEAVMPEGDTSFHFGRTYLMKAEIDSIHDKTMKITVSKYKEL